MLQAFEKSDQLYTRNNLERASSAQKQKLITFDILGLAFVELQA